MNKKILIFWGKIPKKDPIDFGEKRSVYLDLMEKLENSGAEVYLCCGFQNVLESNRYKANFFYKNREILPFNEIISPNSVYDRSGGLLFPQIDSKNVLNNLEFKTLVNNKWLSYLEFPEYFPKTYIIKDLNEIESLSSNFSSNDTLVLKPFDGLKGNLVEFINASDHQSIRNLLTSNSQKSFILQKFINTKKGFGEVLGVHDLRIVIVNNKIVWSHVRTPAAGKLKANVAEGGKITEMELNKIPNEVAKIVNVIKEKFYEAYNNPVYSIDFGIDDGKPYIFEFNDTIGFPLPNMVNKDNFLAELTERLLAFN